MKMLSLIISQLKTEMIMLCMYYTIALNVLIFQNCKMADSFSSSDEDGLTCLLDVVGGGGAQWKVCQKKLGNKKNLRN